jgi:hypothetical protein
MTASTASVVVDTSRLEKGLATMTKQLAAIDGDTAGRQARETAGKIRAQTPRRTGALANTVAAVSTGTGHGVTYGGGLRYAWAMEAKFHPVNSHIHDGARDFRAAAERAGAKAVKV